MDNLLNHNETLVSDNSVYATPDTTLVEENSNDSLDGTLSENASLLDNMNCSGDRNSNILDVSKLTSTRLQASPAGDAGGGETVRAFRGVNKNYPNDVTEVEKPSDSTTVNIQQASSNFETLKKTEATPSKRTVDRTNEAEIRETSGVGGVTAVVESKPVEAGDKDSSLPDTVTVLTSPCGGTVYLVGTAHFSIESQEDVAKTINAVQPNIVMVELCKSRVNILELDEETILEEAKNINLDKIRSTIAQNGVIHGAMYLLLLSMSAHLTKQLGMAPGGEFRRAFKEARQVPGCLVHLGDRPIQITLQRALASLSWWQKLRLTWHIIMSKEPISKEEVEKCKQKDLLEEMLAEMTGEFPALSEVFVKERDVFLTHSLQLAASPIPSPHSMTGCIPSKVVGVVGIGHVPGIVQHWGKVSERDIPPIMRIPPPTLAGKVLKFTVKASLVGLVLWGCYKVLPVPAIKISPSDTVRTVRDSVYQFVVKNP